MLNIDNLTVHYGSALALNNVSLHVKKQEAVCVLGSNGAGKTTLLNAILNIIPKKGRVLYKNIDITNKKTKDIVLLGISYIPDKRTIFKDMSVYDNLLIPAMRLIKLHGKNYFDRSLKELLNNFSSIGDKLRLKAGYLSGGEQQMLSIMQGLLREPELLILDEPTAGLSPKLINEVFNILYLLKDRNIATLIVEQNINKTLRYADRAYIMEVGKIVDKGESKFIFDKDSIKKAYLGG